MRPKTNSGRIGEEMTEAERRAAEFAPTTGEDWAFKVIFADADGDMPCSPHQVAFARDAYEAIGIMPPANLSLGLHADA
jgi:hypothetical protein